MNIMNQKTSDPQFPHRTNSSIFACFRNISSTEGNQRTCVHWPRPSPQRISFLRHNPSIPATTGNFQNEQPSFSTFSAYDVGLARTSVIAVPPPHKSSNTPCARPAGRSIPLPLSAYQGQVVAGPSHQCNICTRCYAKITMDTETKYTNPAYKTYPPNHPLR